MRSRYLLVAKLYLATGVMTKLHFVLRGAERHSLAGREQHSCEDKGIAKCNLATSGKFVIFQTYIVYRTK